MTTDGSTLLHPASVTTLSCRLFQAQRIVSCFRLAVRTCCIQGKYLNWELSLDLEKVHGCRMAYVDACFHNMCVDDSMASEIWCNN